MDSLNRPSRSASEKRASDPGIIRPQVGAMAEIRLPFGLRNGVDPVHVSEVLAGLACGCSCPQCGKQLVAKKGAVLVHHFAHYAAQADDCTWATESALHRLAKNLLLEEKAIWLPDVSSMLSDLPPIWWEGWFQYDAARVEYKINQLRPDLLLMAGEQALMVEIAVSHFCNEAKVRKIEAAGVPAIEIDLSGVNLFDAGTDLRKALLKEAPREWLYHPCGYKRRYEAPKLTMASIELVKRMHDISPAEADKVLHEYIKDELTVREIRGRYDALINYAQPKAMMIVGNPPYFSRGRFPTPDAGKLGLRRAYQDKKVLTEIIQNEIADLSEADGVKVFSDRYEFDFVSPDAVAVAQKEFSINFVDGFEMKKLGEKTAPGVFKKAIAEIVFSATFFRRYWIFLEGTETDAKALTSALVALEADSVGVALVDLDRKQIRILRKPAATPQPDRHSFAKSVILAQGIPA